MRKSAAIFFLLFAVLILQHCTSNKKTGDEAPVLSVEESIKDFEVEKGFVTEIICAEPLIEDPVALNFDEDANMWVVEMRGYMNDKEGGGENLPLGRIKIGIDKYFFPGNTIFIFYKIKRRWFY